MWFVFFFCLFSFFRFAENLLYCSLVFVDCICHFCTTQPHELDRTWYVSGIYLPALKDVDCDISEDDLSPGSVYARSVVLCRVVVCFSFLFFYSLSENLVVFFFCFLLWQGGKTDAEIQEEAKFRIQRQKSLSSEFWDCFVLGASWRMASRVIYVR